MASEAEVSSADAVLSLSISATSVQAYKGNFCLDVFRTCVPVLNMPTVIQIRNVPDALHCRLKSRAAMAGMSLSDYLLSEIREVAERPTLGELQARLERRSGITPSVAPAQMVRAERDRQRSSLTLRPKPSRRR